MAFSVVVFYFNDLWLFQCATVTTVSPEKTLAPLSAKQMSENLLTVLNQAALQTRQARLVTNQQQVQKHRFAAPAQAAKISVPFSQPKINYDERGRVCYDGGAAMHIYFDSVTVQAAPPSAQLFLIFAAFAGSCCKRNPEADSLLFILAARNSQKCQCFHDDE